MGVEIFSREEFEAALPVHSVTKEPLWVSLGLIEGEYAYLVVPNSDRPYGVEVRSSVKQHGTSAGTGEDSIRCWPVKWEGIGEGQLRLHQYGSKATRWITRVPGWQERLTNNLRFLSRVLNSVRPCHKCGVDCVPFKVKKEDSPNKGRHFCTCKNPNCKWPDYYWLDENGKEAADQLKSPASQQQPPVKSQSSTNTQTNNTEVPVCPKCKRECVVRTAGPNSKNPGRNFYGCPFNHGFVSWV